MSTAFNYGTALHRGTAVQPLFPQYGDEGGKEGSRQTRVEYSFDANNGGIGAIPLRECSIGTSWDVPKRGTGDNLEEGMIHFLVIWFEFALNVDDESGCDRREQTSLSPHTNTEVTQGRSVRRTVLTKINVLFESSSHFLIKSR